jgi:hypothetical protein
MLLTKGQGDVMGVQQTIADTTKVYKIAYVHREYLIIFRSGHTLTLFIILVAIRTILFAMLFVLLECVS